MAFPIVLEKPLVFFDLETTGIRIDSDRIVEIALVKINPNGTREEKYSLINPEMPIPPESSKIHGITDEKVKDAPIFKNFATGLSQFLDNCDLSGYNMINFDLPLLQKEFERAQIPFSTEGRSVIDPFVIFRNKEKRNLSAAYQFYCGKELIGAHGAMADISATVEVFESQLTHYNDLPQKITELHTFCNQDSARFVDRGRKLVWMNGEVCINFGKHRNRSLKYLLKTNPDYLQWILGQDFDSEFKKIIIDAQAGKFPTSPTTIPESQA